MRYKKLIRNEQLAELIGIILGDGNLYRHVRTQNLRIVCNSNSTSYIKHIVGLIKRVFHKEPSAIKRKTKQAVNINLYQCKINERLGLPTGNKIKNNVGIPSWIKIKKKLAISCLKGLFETDGCFVEDKDNYTQITEFKNNCKTLREDVYSMLCKLGYHIRNLAEIIFV
jgi:intein/homing endonuclease